MPNESVSSFKILCFIPMKNCAEKIEKTLESFTPSVIKYFEEILIVDNASSDASVLNAKNALAKIPKVKKTLFQNTRNYGLGGSHKIAFKYALDNNYDYILVVHGDSSVKVGDFETWLKNEKFSRFDMLLSDRLASTGYRKNFPFHRFFFNKFLSLMASMITRKHISDFSSGPMNLYRVQSFVNKFENPLKLYPNEVSFPQYLLLYGIYRKMSIRFHSVDLYEQDVKGFYKLTTQFGKSVLLLVRFLFSAHHLLMGDIYGTFFGHTYRKVRVIDEPNDLIIPVSHPENPKESQSEKKNDFAIKNSKPKKELRLIDLQKIPFKDPYLEKFKSLNMDTVEACEVERDGFLNLRLKLEVDTVMSKGLPAFILRLFKIYGEERILLDINADRVLNTRQLHDFLTFCQDFRLNVHLISYRTTDPLLWDLLSKKVSHVTLGYEYGSADREEFYKIAQLVKRNAKLSVNILSTSTKFYHGIGLRDQLKKSGIESLLIQPYEAKSGIAEDHSKFLDAQPMIKPLSAGSAPFQRQHFKFKVEAGNYADLRSIGFMTLKASDKNSVLQTITLDEKGSIFSLEGNRQVPIGTLFDDSAAVINKITEST